MEYSRSCLHSMKAGTNQIFASEYRLSKDPSPKHLTPGDLGTTAGKILYLSEKCWYWAIVAIKRSTFQMWGGCSDHYTTALALQWPIYPLVCSNGYKPWPSLMLGFLKCMGYERSLRLQIPPMSVTLVRASCLMAVPPSWLAARFSKYPDKPRVWHCCQKTVAK